MTSNTGGIVSIASLSESQAGGSVGGRLVRVGACAALVALSLGCDAESPYEPPVPHQPPPPPVAPVPEVFGSVEVKIATSGEAIDPDGFIVQFDGPWDLEAFPTPVGPNGTVTLAYLSPGNHSLTLLGVAANCSGESLAGRPIVITANTVLTVSFQVVCSRPGSSR